MLKSLKPKTRLYYMTDNQIFSELVVELKKILSSPDTDTKNDSTSLKLLEEKFENYLDYYLRKTMIKRLFLEFEKGNSDEI